MGVDESSSSICGSTIVGGVIRESADGSGSGVGSGLARGGSGNLWYELDIWSYTVVLKSSKFTESAPNID